MSDRLNIQGFDVVRGSSDVKIEVDDQLIKTVKSIRDVFMYVFTPEAEAKKMKILAQKELKQKKSKSK